MIPIVSFNPQLSDVDQGPHPLDVLLEYILEVVLHPLSY